MSKPDTEFTEAKLPPCLCGEHPTVRIIHQLPDDPRMPNDVVSVFHVCTDTGQEIRAGSHYGRKAAYQAWHELLGLSEEPDVYICANCNGSAPELNDSGVCGICGGSDFLEARYRDRPASEPDFYMVGDRQFMFRPIADAHAEHHGGEIRPAYFGEPRREPPRGLLAAVLAIAAGVGFAKDDDELAHEDDCAGWFKRPEPGGMDAETCDCIFGRLRRAVAGPSDDPDMWPWTLHNYDPDMGWSKIGSYSTQEEAETAAAAFGEKYGSVPEMKHIRPNDDCETCDGFGRVRGGRLCHVCFGDGINRDHTIEAMSVAVAEARKMAESSAATMAAVLESLDDAAKVAMGEWPDDEITGAAPAQGPGREGDDSDGADDLDAAGATPGQNDPEERK